MTPILAQASEISNFPTTLLGLIGLTLALIINDWVKNRGKNQREESKVSELSQQTKLLAEQRDLLSSIRDGQDYESAKNQKARRRLKIIAAQVGELHDKHITQTQKHEK